MFSRTKQNSESMILSSNTDESLSPLIETSNNVESNLTNTPIESNSKRENVDGMAESSLSNHGPETRIEKETVKGRMIPPAIANLQNQDRDPALLVAREKLLESIRERVKRID